jgi:hypothetical protein
MRHSCNFGLKQINHLEMENPRVELKTETNLFDLDECG